MMTENATLTAMSALQDAAVRWHTSALRRFGAGFGVLVLAGLLGACSSLPENADRSPSYAMPAPTDTQLAKDLAPMLVAHPEQSGFLTLDTGEDAFAARLRLIAAARQSLDVQYYIWHDDLTGRVMYNRLLDAADRGVRVRLLLDDLDTAGKDAILAALDQHPQIEVRVFNPFANRDARLKDVLGSGRRINHRMHNKTITGDNLVTVFGGRNVGDEYFAAAEDVGFGDMDALAVGPIVGEVSEQFDLYWNSDQVYPLAAFVSPEPGDDAALDAFRRQSEEYLEVARESRYAGILREINLSRAGSIAELPLTWSPWVLVYDQPDKLHREKLSIDTHLAPKLLKAFDATETDLVIVSPYFVPGKALTRYLVDLVASGVRVRILTNSLQANDVSLVHAGYMRYRRDLLEGGVELFEFKVGAERTAYRDRDADESRLQLIGASRASLHAKLVVFDRERLFIGSFNLDPRSVNLNTEIGAYYRSVPQATTLVERFEKMLDLFAYRVSLDEDGDLRWTTRENGELVVLDKEPDTTFWKRFNTRLLSWIVPESQL